MFVTLLIVTFVIALAMSTLVTFLSVGQYRRF